MNYLLETGAVSQINDDIEVYLKSPSQFILTYWQDLLPAWKIPPQTLIIFLFRTQISLNESVKLIDEEKEILLEYFQKIGQNFQAFTQEKGTVLEVICPKEGIPTYSAKGRVTFDLIPIIRELLGLEILPTAEGCYTINHPQWKTNVYLGIMLSTASPEQIKPILSLVKGFSPKKP